VLIVAGWALVGLGSAGLVLPLLPATPFFLLAAWCFARSSPRFHAWLMGHAIFGGLIRAYRERRGMPPAMKRWTIASVWVTLGASGVLVPIWWVRAILGAVGVGITLHLLRLRTLRETAPAATHDLAAE
jgi:uncharacterized membrane protein YbaN (DUF454 family)